YLLGDLSESEQSSLEREYFSQPQIFDRLLSVENELVDDYARNRLSEAERAQFEQHYLRHAARRERSAFADALTRRLDQQVETMSGSAVVSSAPRSSFWRRWLASVNRSSLAYAGALVCVILLATGIWLFVGTKRLREQLAETQARQADRQQHVK